MQRVYETGPEQTNKKTSSFIVFFSSTAIDEQNLQTLKYRSESKKVDDGEEVEAAAMTSPTVTVEEPGRSESAFFQRSNIPIITTDMVLDNDDHDADDEDDEVIATSYLKVLPDQMKIASLLVPSFRFFYSSDGDSSTCTTPGQVTPVRSRSPLFGQTGKKNLAI